MCVCIHTLNNEQPHVLGLLKAESLSLTVACAMLSLWDLPAELQRTHAEGAEGRQKFLVGSGCVSRRNARVSKRDKECSTPQRLWSWGGGGGGTLGDTAEGTREGCTVPRTRRTSGSMPSQGRASCCCVYLTKEGKPSSGKKLACENSSQMSFLAKDQHLWGEGVMNVNF